MKRRLKPSVKQKIKLLSSENERTSSAVKQLSGILKCKTPMDVDWKVVKGEYLDNKYSL